MAHYLKERYLKDIKPAMMKEFGFTNPMQVPKLEKIVVNVGVGEALDNAKALYAALDDVQTITGQRPVVTKARKSIANFKLREGRSIGVKVTLRGERMWSFFDRLVNVALPRTRDFRGVSPNSFDGRGNYTLGIREQLIFPEISYDDIDKIRGFEVTIVTSAPNDEQGRRLIDLLGMPFGKAEFNGKKCMTYREQRRKYKTRVRNRCRICGRPRGYYRRFELCRICLREQALEGKIPGLVKSSW